MILLFSKTENIRIPGNINSVKNYQLTSGAYLNRYRKQVDKIEPLRSGAQEEWFISNRLSSTIGENREMDQLYMTSQVSNITSKTTFSPISGLVFQD